MLDSPFSSVLSTTESAAASITPANFLICSLASIVLGLIVAAAYSFRYKGSRGFVATLAILPLVVQAVIMLVNGNLGVGVAVMGVFSLVRFRSIAGTAKDIGSVFMAMAVGLATGMGFLGLAALFTVVVSVLSVLYTFLPTKGKDPNGMILHITVPETMEYEGVFDEVLGRLCASFELSEVSTSNMGSLYHLTYKVDLPDKAGSKQLLDELRALNGNLKIKLSNAPSAKEVL